MLFMGNQKRNNNNKLLPLSVNLIIGVKHNKPALEIRRLVMQPEYIKAILDAGFTNQPIIIMPQFSDRIRAIGCLCEKNIIEYDSKTKRYNYLI